MAKHCVFSLTQFPLLLQVEGVVTSQLLAAREAWGQENGRREGRIMQRINDTEQVQKEKNENNCIGLKMYAVNIPDASKDCFL